MIRCKYAEIRICHYAWVRKYLSDTEPRMAYKLDRLVRVIRKRIKKNKRYIDKVLKENIS